MKFNKSRFAKLAGLPQSRGTLNESRRRKAMRRRAMLNEGLYGGRSERMIDTFDPFDDEEIEMVRYDDRGADPRRVSTQFNLDDLDGDDYAQMMYDDYLDGGVDDDDDMLYEAEDHKKDEMNYEMNYEMDHMGEGGMHYERDMEEEGMDHMMYEEEASEDMHSEQDVIEISDADLVKEVRNIKRKRINEARLKAVIEDELREVLAEMQYGSDWMYGEDKPAASKKGHVTRGFKGLGFK